MRTASHVHGPLCRCHQPRVSRAWRSAWAGSTAPVRHAGTVVRAALGLAVCVGALGAQVTERVSVDSSGVQGNFASYLPSPTNATVSGNGRFVAFQSGADNLVPGDTNGKWDVFVRDRLTGTTERVSVDSGGVQADGDSGLYGLAITPDGRYVAFESRASNLVTGDTNGARDIFVRDRQTGTTERVSIDSNGTQGNGNCFHFAITPDGRYVAFESAASNLVAGDMNAHMDVFLHDRVNGTTELVSLSTSGAQGDGDCNQPSISDDGRFVAFYGLATNLGPMDTNGHEDVFVRDRQVGLTTRVSRSSSGTQGNGDSYWPSISSDGRYVAFTSDATNLVSGDTNGSRDVFVNDRFTAITARVSVAGDGSQGDGLSTDPSFSADGHFLSFMSSSTNLIPGGLPTNNSRIFVRDQMDGTIELVSTATDGSLPTVGGCGSPWISGDGRYVAFWSNASDVVPGDTNGEADVFIHDRFASGFTSLCDPGQNNVIDCPCGNPPAGSGRGCDNSSFTGGASLSATGIAYLATDSLSFKTTGEKPSATSILLQGNASISNGVVIGQGVRCVGGTFKRLFTKAAAGGSILAPDFAVSDPSVSSRSATLGDPILPGESRFYLVYYRDPIVLGGCAATSTYNATQSGQVTWWP
jgi:Tol biopolymer transport system component